MVFYSSDLWVCNFDDSGVSRVWRLGSLWKYDDLRVYKIWCLRSLEGVTLEFCKIDYEIWQDWLGSLRVRWLQLDNLRIEIFDDFWEFALLMTWESKKNFVHLGVLHLDDLRVENFEDLWVFYLDDLRVKKFDDLRVFYFDGFWESAILMIWESLTLKT